MKVVVAGGTGFIGGALVARLGDAGHEVVILSRRPATSHALPSWMRCVGWDGESPGEWEKEVNGAGAVINLAGEPIAGRRWTLVQKARLVSSRLNATSAIVRALERAAPRPGVLVNASAVGYYGHVEDGDVDERHPEGKDFLGKLCGEWEREALRAESLGVRVVLLRTGIVLEKGGGALKKLMLPFRLSLGGPPGSGRQYVPWIHRDDMVGIILFALVHPSLAGPVNCAAPQPLRMEEFCRALGAALGRPSWLHVPKFLLRVAMGEMATTVLTGQKVVPTKVLEAGYIFRYPSLAGALDSILR